MGYIGNIPVPDSTEHRQEFTATASQTTFTTSGYANGFVDVYLNGVKLAAADFTANDNSTVVLTSGASAGDVLAVVARTQTTDGSAGFASTSEVQGVHTTATTTKASNANELTSVAAVSGYSLSDVSVGDYVTGEGILVGTTVSAINGTTITLTHPDGDALSSSMTDLASDPVTFYNATKALSAGTIAGGLCRAWANFNGTGTVAIRASFNVSSITDNATGYYDINLTTALPDTNGCLVATAGDDTENTSKDSICTGRQISTSAFYLSVYRPSLSGNHDPDWASVAVFR